jgi:hypothetical protein
MLALHLSSGKYIVSERGSQPFSRGLRKYPRCPERNRRVTICGKEAKFGPFSPLVLGFKAVMGERDFNKLRGKGISLHSQVIKEFGSKVGAEGKQVQGLIRLAKKNGDTLGFLS